MDVNVSTLENGLTIITDEVKTVETVSLGIWNKVGARNEKKEVNGISHLIEHMVFKGTKNRSSLEIVSDIEEKGGMLNAYTSRDTTAYYAKMLKQDANLAFDVISDMIINPTFDEKELQREKEVVVQEINQSHDVPDEDIFDIFQAKMFPNQSIGRPILGTKETVRNMKKEDLFSYLKDFYTPSNMIVSASGNIKHKDFVDIVGEKLSFMKKGDENKVERQKYQGGLITQKRDIEQINMLLGFKSFGFLDKQYYPMSVLSMLLGGGMTSRLFQEVREKKGLVYSVYSFASARKDGGVFGIFAGTGKQEIKELIPTVFGEIKKVCQDITKEEVKRAKTQLKASLLMALESTSTRCEQAARQKMVYDRVLPVSEIIQKVDDISRQDVIDVAQEIFSSDPTIALNGALEEKDYSYEKFTSLLK